MGKGPQEEGEMRSVAFVFISHSSSDRDAAERLGERLRAEGFATQFLDFDPDQGIPADRNWERQLYTQLRKTDAVIFLASAASVASRWCFAEVSVARSLDKPIFPLRVEGDARLELLDDLQWIDLSEGERAYARLWERLRQAGFDPSDSFAWDHTRSPYPGLQPFSPQDAAVFFGRDHEIERLLELVQPVLQRGVARRLMAIVGPSGSGKSSLVRAGLLPRLEHLRGRWVVVPPMLPGQKPTRNLARSLAQAFSARGHERSPAELERHLGTSPAALGEMAGELAEITDGGSNGAEPNVLVVIDQAEELITRSGEREQQLFLGLLGGALNEQSPLWVVATVRSEFLSSAPERAGLADLVGDSLLVEPLSRTRLPEVIERPAQRVGLYFEPGLVGRMVEDTIGGDALPLLAYTLQELWELMRREGRPERTVRFADYEAVGGVVGALERRADWITEELTQRGQGSLILPTLLKLASVEGEEEPTRRRLRRSALAPEEEQVVDAFIEARLLTSGKSENGTEEGAAIVEVAHEALLRQWTPLRQVIEEERSSLRMRRYEAKVASGTGAAADRIWEIYKVIGEEERHFNQIQHHYRVLTSTWLLATFAAAGYVLSNLTASSNEGSWLTSYSELIVAAVALFGAVGIRLLWLLDIKVYHQLLDACFVVGVKLERQNEEWLPPIRKTMLDTQSAQSGHSDQGVLVQVVWFYTVCTTALLAIWGLFSSIWLYRLLYERTVYAESIAGGFLLMVVGAIFFWGYTMHRQTRSYSLESLYKE
jgi:hypothetical protein